MTIAIAPSVTHTGQVGGSDRVFGIGYFDGISDGANTATTAEISGATINVRRKLAANTTFYVRSGGNDSNDGLSTATPFATINRAKEELKRIDGNGYNATVDIGPGTWTISGNNTIGSQHCIGITQLIFNGNGLGNTVLSGTANAQLFYIEGTASTAVKVQNMKLTGGATHIVGRPFTQLYFANIDFGSCTNVHIWLYSSSCFIEGAYTISGSATNGHAAIQHNSYFLCLGRTITLVDTPSLNPFLSPTRSSYIYYTGNTFSGTATGKRYAIGPLSMIETGTGNPDLLPGDSAGTVSTFGGYYS